MTRLPTKTGLGDTQLIVLPRPSAVPSAPKDIACPLEPACHNFDGRECAACLQLAVENAQREGARGKLAQAIHHRQQFWMDTCRGVMEMEKASPQVLKLHQQHGCCFSTPSSQQVQQILDALDSALPGWSGDHPELFHQTLELNFPGLLRVFRA
jgi:hypothetical protein